jgi:hypothetical protein
VRGEKTVPLTGLREITRQSQSFLASGVAVLESPPSLLNPAPSTDKSSGVLVSVRNRKTIVAVGVGVIVAVQVGEGVIVSVSVGGLNSAVCV